MQSNINPRHLSAILTIAICCFICPSLTCQERYGAYMLYAWRLGLSAGQNTFVCESDDGFLWIATENGLVRFDGRNFRRVPSGPNGITDNLVTAIALSGDQKSLWVGSLRRGAARFDVSSQTFRPYPKLWHFDSHLQRVSKIVCLPNGEVYLGTSDMGLARYLPAPADTFQFYAPAPIVFHGGVPTNRYSVTDMVLDPSDPDQIWLLCNNGVYRFDTRAEEFIAYYVPTDNEVYWTSIAHDGQNGLWLGSWGNGPFHFDVMTR